jgi:hypothetical protein
MTNDLPLDPSKYGDPEDHQPAHVAPLCSSCGEREAVASFSVGGESVPLCRRCALADPGIEDAQVEGNNES